MPVDKFGRMSVNDTSESSGVSLTYINNNFLRRDGTNTATGSINMVGNTLTNVSDPANAQDAATKNYVDSNGSAGKVSKSGDTMTGSLNMGGNRVMSLPFSPTDTSDAVSAAYVIQNGLNIEEKAVLRNGTQSMAGHFNMGNNFINNVLDPANAQDAATKNYVDTHALGFWKTHGPHVYIHPQDENFTPPNTTDYQTLSFITLTIPGVKVGDYLEIYAHLGVDYTAYHEIGDLVKVDVATGTGLYENSPLVSSIVGGDNHIETAYMTYMSPVNITRDANAVCTIKVKSKTVSSRTYLANQCGLYVKHMKK